MASETLKTLLERRDTAYTSFQEFAAPIVAEERDMTEDEETQHKSLRKTVKTLDKRIKDLEEDERVAAEAAEARTRILGADTPTVYVTSEPRTYGEDSPNSYFADRAWGSSPEFPQHDEARRRLATYAAEIAAEMRDPNSKEGRRARKQIQESLRAGNTSRAAVNDSIDRAANFTQAEVRSGMDTTASSGGSFVTPQYFVSDYAPYRQYGRVFADQAHKMSLPDYGMTIYVPHITAAAAVSAQAGQNQGIAETDPTAAYLSVALTTNAGQVTVSQQLLDRAGPNFAFDKMVFDQLNRAYNLTLDTYVLTQAIANATSVSNSYSSFAWQTFLQKIAGGKANIQDTAGTVLPASHIFAQPSTWEWITAQIDASGGSNRPGAVPSYAGPYNAFAAGDPSLLAEGNTGYRVLGLPVYEDANIPVDGSAHNQVLVTSMDEVWFWEGDLVTRAVPQTFAQNLSVLLQVYAYVGCIVRYSPAVQTISGSSLNVTF
jgi:hypothetical protein